MKNAMYELQWCVRGYNIVMKEWEAAFGENSSVNERNETQKTATTATAYAAAVVLRMLLLIICPQKILVCTVGVEWLCGTVHYTSFEQCLLLFDCHPQTFLSFFVINVDQ